MLGLVIRLIISALVLMLVGFLLPGFDVGGFGGAFLAAIAIAILGYVVNMLMSKGYIASVFTGKKKASQRRGIIGFIIAVIVIYVAQFFVQAMSVTVLGAVLAAAVIGVIDMFLPTVLGKKF